MSTIAAETSTAASAADIPSKRITPQELERLSARVVSTAGNDPMEIEQPFTGKPLGSVPKCGPEDVRAAIERARAAQEPWAQTSLGERRRVLMRDHHLVLDKQEELLDLLQIESGKARRHAFEEVLDVAITSRYYANTAEEHLKPRNRGAAPPPLPETRKSAHRRAVGGRTALRLARPVWPIGGRNRRLAAGNGVVM